MKELRKNFERCVNRLTDERINNALLTHKRKLNDLTWQNTALEWNSKELKRENEKLDWNHRELERKNEQLTGTTEN